MYRSIEQAGASLQDGVIALGNFDGVHLGHQVLIKEAIANKGQHLCGVLTFSPHPAQILTGQQVPLLTPDEIKIRLLKKSGLDVVVVQPVDSHFLSLSKEAFVSQILVDGLRIKHVVVGHDFRFGHYAAGDVTYLASAGHRFSFLVHVIEPVLVDGERCSSSAIRSYLNQGDMAKAHAMLGRHYSIVGRVMKGQQLGKKLGFATANIMPFSGFCLKNGVYATITRVFEGESYQDYPSATNVGTRPTVTHEKTVVVESHCLDVELDLYDKEIEIFFYRRLRDEEKFESLELLKQQIVKDCITARGLLME